MSYLREWGEMFGGTEEMYQLDKDDHQGREERP